MKQIVIFRLFITTVLDVVNVGNTENMIYIHDMDMCAGLFVNCNDMMDLYQKIENDGNWKKFLDFVFVNFLEPYQRKDFYYSTKNIAQLFCLTDQDYEKRCWSVVEWVYI